jgi:hypothetical protein
VGEKGNAAEVATAALGATAGMGATSVTAIVDAAGNQSADALTMIQETAEKRVAERVVDRAEGHIVGGDEPGGGAPGGSVPGA